VLLSPANSVDSALDLATAVRVRSWTWLFQIGSALSVDVRIVDLRTAPVLSPPSEPVSTTLRAPEFVAAVGRAQRAQSIETLQIGKTLVACVVLRVAGSDSGVLAVSRRVSAKPLPQAEQWRLEQIASFLRPAIEAHLETDIAPSGEEGQRLGALRRALADCESGSELDLLRVFGDAVSIWEDVDVRAYAEAVNGEYVQQWAPAGAAGDQIPAVLTSVAALQTRELSRLPAQSLDQLGIVSREDIVVAQIAPDGSRWMLMFTRGVDPACLNRLSLYVDILEQSLKRLAISATLQLCRNVWDRLLTSDQNPARAAEAALADIVRGICGDFAALLVTFPHGGRAVAVGDVGRFADLQAPASPGQLAMTRLLETGGTLVIAVGRREGRASFSSGERDLLETIADMLESWAAAIIRRPAAAGERRAAARPFQQVVEEVAQQTLRSGNSVSVVVIRLGGGEFRPGAAHRLAAQIRSHLRATEPAGALTEGEIAAVLFDTNRDQARAVISRLRGLGSSLDEGEALASAAMGVAHCAAGSVYDVPLVLAAREDALRSANDVSSGGRIQ
jgi:hypothetical protein